MQTLLQWVVVLEIRTSSRGLCALEGTEAHAAARIASIGHTASVVKLCAGDNRRRQLGEEGSRDSKLDSNAIRQDRECRGDAAGQTR